MMERSEAPGGGKAESILAAAKRTFLESGFGAVSMDAIAREAGVSKATVYAHFAGKEELFGAVVGRECERYFAGFSAGELDPGDVRASLTTLGRRFLDLVLSPEASRCTASYWPRSPAFRCWARFSGTPDPSAPCPDRSIPARRRRGRGARIADTRLAAEQFVGLMRGEIHLRQLLRLEAAGGAASDRRRRRRRRRHLPARLRAPDAVR